MRTLSKDEKSFLDKIARYDNSTLNPVSDIISEIFPDFITFLRHQIAHNENQ